MGGLGGCPMALDGLVAIGSIVWLAGWQSSFTALEWSFTATLACPVLPAALAALAGWLPQEPEPMGTAGPLALARDILWNDQNIPFFVLNRWVGGSFWVCCVWGVAI